MKAYSTHTLLQWCSVYLSGVLFQMKVHKFYSFFHSLEKNNSSVNDQKDGIKWNPIIISFFSTSSEERVNNPRSHGHFTGLMAVNFQFNENIFQRFNWENARSSLYPSNTFRHPHSHSISNHLILDGIPLLILII